METYHEAHAAKILLGLPDIFFASVHTFFDQFSIHVMKTILQHGTLIMTIIVFKSCKNLGFPSILSTVLSLKHHHDHTEVMSYSTNVKNIKSAKLVLEFK